MANGFLHAQARSRIQWDERESSPVGGRGFRTGRGVAQPHFTGRAAASPPLLFQASGRRDPPGQFLPCSCSSKETAHFSQVDLGTVPLAACTEGFPPRDQNPVVREGLARAPPTNRALSAALKTIIRPDLSVAARMRLSPASSPPSPAPG